eukprot:CAMPEP_0167779816 /NCGR_PEP_ID=MMETSP0111_2-20121227/5012_1 /TAXON_ID=91324 /ORGANISM="Lotharella globosa, Strain CCCM811" /LENGTH=108 /DNA_ID=CAMNT_0007670259 /DNA_START=141 /DNA_END=468 /DNA_ORIENTATION=+
MAHTVTYNTKWVSSDGKPFKSIPIISMQNLRSQTSMMDEKKSTSPYLAQPRSPMNPKRVGSSPRDEASDPLADPLAEPLAEALADNLPVVSGTSSKAHRARHLVAPTI